MNICLRTFIQFNRLLFILNTLYINNIRLYFIEFQIIINIIHIPMGWNPEKRFRDLRRQENSYHNPLIIKLTQKPFHIYLYIIFVPQLKNKYHV